MIIRPNGTELEAFDVDLAYPAWDTLHEMIPRKWFYGGLFFDKHGEIVDIIETGDTIIKHRDGSWSLCKYKDFDRLYSVVINEA